VDTVGFVLGYELVEHGSASRIEFVRPGNIDLVDDNKDWLVGKERFDGCEKLDLGFKGIATLLGKIHEVHDATSEMSKSGDTLHFDCVHFLERMIQDSGRIDYLPPEVLIVHMTNEERLGRESVRLNIYICSCNLVDEG
jgi:hypothetical protein